MLRRLAIEPPFRVLVRKLLNWLPVSVETRALWDLSKRPPYLLGVLTAARRAQVERIDRICVIEFGVAGGEGLLALEEAAASVERELRVGIDVYGFDNGLRGLPPPCGDYRDHPDFWKAGDFPMDEETLRSQIDERRTHLILGNVAETVTEFLSEQVAPVGFAAFDLDLYTSTKDALRIFSDPRRNMLMHVPVYFDDIEFLINHRFAGELLAIDEFNGSALDVKLDRWYGVKAGRPFPEQLFLDKLYVAHDLRAITKASLERENVCLPLRRYG